MAARSKTGPSVAGGGGGALLLNLLIPYQNTRWGPVLLYLAPTASLAISASVAFLRTQLDEYVERKKLETIYDEARRTLLAMANDPNLSTTSQEKARRGLEELDARRIDEILDKSKKKHS